MADQGVMERSSSPGTTENTLHKEGDFWTFVYDGRTIWLPHSKGLAYLRILLERPGTPVRAGELRRRVGGRPSRPVETPSLRDQRDRLSVTKAIQSALARIRKADPALGAYLQETVRTGTRCEYIEDQGSKWRF